MKKSLGWLVVLGLLFWGVWYLVNRQEQAPTSVESAVQESNYESKGDPVQEWPCDLDTQKCP